MGDSEMKYMLSIELERLKDSEGEVAALREFLASQPRTKLQNGFIPAKQKPKYDKKFLSEWNDATISFITGPKVQTPRSLLEHVLSVRAKQVEP